VEQSEGHSKVLGFELFYRSFGKPEKGTLLALHGGPGATHDYLLPLADLAQFGYRVVFMDQLGCGRSERPRSRKHYTIEHNVEEVEGVRKALRLARVSLMGHSYGGALAIATALKYQRNLRSLIIASGTPSFPLANAELWRRIDRLPPRLRSAIRKYDSAKDYGNPRYLKALKESSPEYPNRLRVMPHELVHTLGHQSMPVIHAMWGHPDSVRATGNIRDWDVTDQLPTVRVPTLITAGRCDWVMPRVARSIQRGIRNSKLLVFEKSGHLHFWENRSRYIEVVRDFLAASS
jgi:proline iminopeptidase